MKRASVDVCPSCTLAEVAGWLEVKEPAVRSTVRVTSLCVDSRECRPGALFFAVPGHQHNGLDFVDDAVRRGAVAVIVEEAPPTATARSVAVLQVPDVRHAKAQVAHEFYGHPSRGLTCVGITGTNGKTTTATMLHSILGNAGRRPTFIGTTKDENSSA